MGCFSWNFCDIENQNLVINNDAWLLIPNGDNIYEKYYGGYGVFGGLDVYDLVVDWNKDFIPIMLTYADKGLWICDVSERDRKNLQAYYNDEQIDCEKRWLGIMMACYDEDNARLFYPIKIAQYNNNYNSMPPSTADEYQGFCDCNSVNNDEDDYWC